MGASTGIQALNNYAGAATLAARIQLLTDLIPDVDTASSSGAQAGAVNLNGKAGFLDEMSPAAAVQLRVELDALKGASDAGGDGVAFGFYTVTAADATANLVNIVTGLADTSLADIAVTVTRSGSIVTADAVISEPSAGTIRIADGSTYNTTAGDIIAWFARDPSA